MPGAAVARGTIQLTCLAGASPFSSSRRVDALHERRARVPAAPRPGLNSTASWLAHSVIPGRRQMARVLRPDRRDACVDLRGRRGGGALGARVAGAGIPAATATWPWRSSRSRQRSFALAYFATRCRSACRSRPYRVPAGHGFLRRVHDLLDDAGGDPGDARTRPLRPWRGLRAGEHRGGYTAIWLATRLRARVRVIA